MSQGLMGSHIDVLTLDKTFSVNLRLGNLKKYEFGKKLEISLIFQILLSLVTISEKV